MVVTMAIMSVVGPAVHQVIDVISVRNSFMTTARSMHMLFGMTASFVASCAVVRMFAIDLDLMPGNSISLLMLQLAV